MDGYTRAFPQQRLGKHFPVARQHILNNATVGLQQWKNCVSTWSVPRSYKQRARSVVNSVRESVKRGLEAEEYPLLEPLPGNF
jgi:hypothetical protein